MQFKVCQFNFLLCALCVLCGEFPALAQLPDELRVLTYNIHHGEGVDGKIDLERIAAVIKSVEPHIVAVQEVDQGTARTARVDQPAELARLTGLHPVTMLLGTSPGGIAEMAITAKVLQLGAPVVTAFQVCRLVAVLVLAEPVYRWRFAQAQKSPA